MPSFTHLVLGAGGMSCLTYLGVLKYLQEHDLHSSIRHYYGVSMGAFFSFLFALGVPYDVLQMEIAKVYCDPEQTYSSFPSLTDIHANYGIDSGERMTVPLKNIYRRLYNESFPKQSYDIDDLTFLEFTKHTGVTITVVATDVYRECPTFFSVDITPNVCIWSAIQASMTIPMVFTPTHIGDSIYVDGVMTCEFPVPVPQISKLPLHSTLGIFLDTRKKQTEFTETGTAATAAHSAHSSLWDYTLRILQLQLFYTKELFLQTQHLKHTLWIKNTPTALLPIKIQDNGFTIDLTLQELEDAVACGYHQSHTYLSPLFTKTLLSPSPESKHTI
jgi:NTE family protein